MNHRRLRGVALVAAVFSTAASAPLAPSASNVTAASALLSPFPPSASNLTVAASFPLEQIRSSLFGLDLELTRHDVWSGLSAELVANRLFAVQPPGTRWPFPWPAGFPPRWAALPGGAAPAVNGLSSAVTCALSAQQPRCGLQQLPVGDGFDGGMSFGSAIGVEAGRGYTFRAVVRATGTAGGVGLVLSVVLAPGIFAANLTVPDTTATAAWTEVAFSFIAGATTARADSLTLAVSGAQGALDFNATSLLPDDSFLGMRSDVVDALGDLGFAGPLRYPGGCFAPFFRWKDSLLPLLARPTAFTPPAYCTAVAGGVNAYSDGFMQNGPGIDEYMALTRRVGAMPAVTFALQFGTDDEIQDARDWVEYLNGDAATTTWGALRAARGHYEPYAVKIFYMGNEIAWQARYPNYPADPGNSTGAMNGVDYQAMLERLIPAVRAVDPSVQLLAVDADDTFNQPWINSDFTPFVSATSAHIAYANSDSGGSPASATAATVQAKLATGNVLAALAGTRQMLNAGAGTGSHVSISVDEWGLGPPWVVENFNCAHALYGASFLSMIINEAAAYGVSFTNNFEPINEGAIEVLQFTAQPTPLGAVMPAFSALAGATRLAVSQQPAAAGDPDVIGVAALGANGAAITVVLTNRNATDGVTQFVRFYGVGVAPSATVELLTATGFSTNSTFAPSTFSVAVVSASPKPTRSHTPLLTPTNPVTHDRARTAGPRCRCRPSRLRPLRWPAFRAPCKQRNSPSSSSRRARSAYATGPREAARHAFVPCASCIDATRRRSIFERRERATPTSSPHLPLDAV